MSFNPRDLHDVADLAGIVQREKMLQKLAQSTTDGRQLQGIASELARLRSVIKDAEERQRSLPQCPVCGGRLEGQFRKCKYCTSDLAWVQGLPCEPGKERELMLKISEDKRLAGFMKCARCGLTVAKRYASPGGLCEPCAKGHPPIVPAEPRTETSKTSAWTWGVFWAIVCITVVAVLVATGVF